MTAQRLTQYKDRVCPKLYPRIHGCMEGPGDVVPRATMFKVAPERLLMPVWTVWLAILQLRNTSKPVAAHVLELRENKADDEMIAINGEGPPRLLMEGKSKFSNFAVSCHSGPCLYNIAVWMLVRRMPRRRNTVTYRSQVTRIYSSRRALSSHGGDARMSDSKAGVISVDRVRKRDLTATMATLSVRKDALQPPTSRTHGQRRSAGGSRRQTASKEPPSCQGVSSASGSGSKTLPVAVRVVLMSSMQTGARAPSSGQIAATGRHRCIGASSSWQLLSRPRCSAVLWDGPSWVGCGCSPGSDTSRCALAASLSVPAKALARHGHRVGVWNGRHLEM